MPNTFVVVLHGVIRNAGENLTDRQIHGMFFRALPPAGWPVVGQDVRITRIVRGVPSGLNADALLADRHSVANLASIALPLWFMGPLGTPVMLAAVAANVAGVLPTAALIREGTAVAAGYPQIITVAGVLDAPEGVTATSVKTTLEPLFRAVFAPPVWTAAEFAPYRESNVSEDGKVYAVNGPRAFWTSGEAFRTRTRAAPLNAVDAVRYPEENPVGPTGPDNPTRIEAFLRATKAAMEQNAATATLPVRQGLAELERQLNEAAEAARRALPSTADLGRYVKWALWGLGGIAAAAIVGPPLVGFITSGGTLAAGRAAGRAASRSNPGKPKQSAREFVEAYERTAGKAREEWRDGERVRVMEPGREVLATIIAGKREGGMNIVRILPDDDSKARPINPRALERVAPIATGAAARRVLDHLESGVRHEEWRAERTDDPAATRRVAAARAELRNMERVLASRA